METLALLRWGDDGWGDEILAGAVMTLAVAVCAFLVSLVLGALFAAFRLSPSPVLRFAGDVYTTVLRGVPELLVIYLVFFGGGQLVQLIAGVFGHQGHVDLPLFLAGTLCIGLSSGAYTTEVLRGGVLAVPPGQIEAAVSIGMGPVPRFFRILVPQTLRFALPGLGNIWQLVLKDTSLISVIGLVELMRTARLGAGSTREPFTFYSVAFLVFLLFAWLSGRLFLRIENWSLRGTQAVPAGGQGGTGRIPWT